MLMAEQSFEETRADLEQSSGDFSVGGEQNITK